MQIRRDNIQVLVDEIGGGRQSTLAHRADLPPSMISQVINGTRNVGERLARKIETNLGLERYALDTPLSDELPSSIINADILAQIIEGTLAATRKIDPDADIRQVARMCVQIYTAWLVTGDLPDFEQAVRLAVMQA